MTLMRALARICLQRRAPHHAPALVLALCVGLAACGSGNGPQINHGKGLSCVDDSAYCIGERRSALNHLVNRSDRHWVHAQPSAHAYASGVRLYAFKKKKKDLTCDELRVAGNEAKRAPKILRGPEGRSLTPAQISRGVMFAEEVGRELAREQSRRCRRG
ncbi:MAG: hypothetical protein ACK5KM_02485 [Hyphomicrobiaceae bacterium]